ncbi:MAG: hypothetical protein J0H74_21340 [Chitinophagaceae bacterium]|nr:hypothetical protein [Chitinophagaceae bacterium]
MRTLCLSLLLLLVYRDAGAQTHSNDYVILSADVGAFFAGTPGHDVATTFPYTVTPVASGVRHQETFDGALKGKFTSPSYMAGLSLGYFWKRNSVDAGVGLYRSDGGDHGVYLKAGYGYGVHVGGLVLRPTVDFYYLMGKNKMGTIDNSGVDINLLGFTAFDQFTVAQDDGNGGTYDAIYNADHLDVNYRRFNLLANPKIVLSTKPLGRLVVSLELGWLLQLHQRCDLQLEQTSKSSSETYTVGKVRLDRNGSLGGAFAAINIGVRL